MQRKEESKGYQFLKELRNVLPAKMRGATYQELNKALLHDPMFVELMKSSPSAITIFSYESMTYEYFSPNMEEMLGYPIEKLQGTSGAEFAINTFHPDHLNIILPLTEIVKKYVTEYSLQERVKDLRITWVLQLKKGDGEYIWTLQQNSVLEVTPEGFPLRTLVTINDITGVKTNNKVDFVVSLKRQNRPGYEILYASHHEPSKDYILTEREVQILECISKGMRNHEIANMLNISKHTVITHRRNIMKKTGTESIIKLLIN